MTLLVDNYDSFTYILADYFLQLGLDLEVVRVDQAEHEVDWDQVRGLVLSPGPGHPIDNQALMRIVASRADNQPTLGICLGHQALALHYGRSAGGV
ncbi:MAG: aminodeoxychorismate/anthranilate synthase component II, partial [Cytophagales bacterium]|nr:aminodeoxychorismate/anthranilate synthase component II [Cytophagales bacterium]